MQSLAKKLKVIALATALISGGISSVAIAADSNKEQSRDKAPQRELMMPPAMAKALGDLSLTDAQKARLKAIKAKREALQDEFWAVFTDEQKTAMLKKVLKKKSHHHKAMHNKGKRGREHHERERRERKHWQQDSTTDSQ